jgi:hypothetical protein
MNNQFKVIDEATLSAALSRFGQLGIFIGSIMLALSFGLSPSVEKELSISIIIIGLLVWLSEYLPLKYMNRALIIQIIFSVTIGAGIVTGVFYGSFVSWLFLLPVSIYETKNCI